MFTMAGVEGGNLGWKPTDNPRLTYAMAMKGKLTPRAQSYASYVQHLKGEHNMISVRFEKTTSDDKKKYGFNK